MSNDNSETLGFFFNQGDDELPDDKKAIAILDEMWVYIRRRMAELDDNEKPLHKSSGNWTANIGDDILNFFFNGGRQYKSDIDDKLTEMQTVTKWSYNRLNTANYLTGLQLNYLILRYGGLIKEQIKKRAYYEREIKNRLDNKFKIEQAMEVLNEEEFDEYCKSMNIDPQNYKYKMPTQTTVSPKDWIFKKKYDGVGEMSIDEAIDLAIQDGAIKDDSIKEKGKLKYHASTTGISDQEKVDKGIWNFQLASPSHQ